MQSQNFLNPKFNITFEDLYDESSIGKIDEQFRTFLKVNDADLFEAHCALVKEDSEILIKVAKHLEDFLVELFLIKNENDQLKNKHFHLSLIYKMRLEYVQRYIAKKFNIADVDDKFDYKFLLRQLEIYHDDIDEIEVELVRQISNQKNLNLIEKYSIWALFSKEGKTFHKDGALFILPKKIDEKNLINEVNFKTREGFDLTDNGFSLNRIQGEANYCLFCHKQNKDSCKKGLFEKDNQQIKFNNLGNELHGCPLDEKISEMNFLKSIGCSIASLAIAVIDNPMIAGTGHRICNDCMKSCIYQKQDPVDIPQIETRILKDVLSLPYGFEIYSLLTRWNPLNINNPLPKSKTGKKVLICGLGPSGYTLAHYLLNSGHEVVAIDGLKIEPLNQEISGIDLNWQRTNFKPIKFVDEIYEDLSKRVIYGFGGVAEYGITSRFNKNFLKIIRLLIERRKNFLMYGGLRFGSSITDKIAFEEYGFDHVALCIGAGRPQFIDIKNNFAKGVRLASDFLMSLQLTGAFKENLFTNLQIRLPIIVIGGGLTAVDTACEAKAYYEVQVKKFAKKILEIGKEKLWSILNEEEKIIAQEFLDHAKKINDGIKDFISAKILYRKKIIDSPAYKLNHQELKNALEEGVEFIEDTELEEIMIDNFSHIKSIKTKDNKIINCGSLFIAIGTKPNISPALEDELDLKHDGKYFVEIDKDNNLFSKTYTARPSNFSVITKIDSNSKKAVSFFGDLHPNFEGNVVKAMTSAKQGYQQINEILKDVKKTINIKRDFREDFLVKIHSVERLSNHVVEILVKAPLLANQTKVGQIFRLHNYHVLASQISNQILAMEGVVVTALSIDKENGLISGIIVETGGSSSLIQNFKRQEPCVFMGPSGKPTEIPQNETVLLVGGGRGNQPLTALAEIFTANNCEVIFFAGYKRSDYIVRESRMISSCSKLIISVEDKNIKDPYFKGSVIDAIKEYFEKRSQKIDRIFAIGNDSLLYEVAKLRKENIVLDFAKAKYSISSLNSPMQCMMKGVCGQCIQKKYINGKVDYFYSCANQDQNSDNLDFKHLHNRCAQNSLAEKTSKSWLNFLYSAN
jgi:NADPH-dependent glutamate synthase beta subunit-like oxidoreductase/NAD(P)H-flavin reductase